MPSSASARPARPSRWSLAAFVALLALCELTLNRVASRLLALEPPGHWEAMRRVVDTAGAIAFHWLGCLAAIVLAYSLLHICLGARGYRIGARLSVTLIGGALLLLVVLGTALRLPAGLVLHMHMSLLFFAVLMAIVVLSSSLSGWHKLGTIFLLVPIACRVGAQIAGRSVMGDNTEVAEVMQVWLRGGEIAGLVAGLLAPIFFTRASAKRRGFALTLAWVLASAAGFFIVRDWDSAARVASFAFGVELPISRVRAFPYVVALATVSYTIIVNLAERGGPRLFGIGLLILATAGLVYELPVYVALCAIGFLCFAEAAISLDGPGITREAFDELVKDAARLIGAPTATITGEPGFETARVHSPVGGTHLEVVIQRNRERIDRVEVTRGEPPPRVPPFSLTHEDARGLGPRGSGPRIETGDTAFDAAFTLHDGRSVGAAILDDASRARLLTHAHGHLAIWPDTAARYRARTLPSGSDSLAVVVALVST